MSDKTEPQKQENLDLYHGAIAENNEIYNSNIKVSSDRAYEYGVLAVKSILYLNGGALIALPTFFTLIGTTKEAISWIACWFLIGLVLAIITIYLVHLNWMQNYHHLENEKIKREMEIEYAFLGYHREREVTYAEMPRRAKKNLRWVYVTFYSPHLAGVVSLLMFIIGSFEALSVSSAMAQ
jgi:uncharacterized membrane protein